MKNSDVILDANSFMGISNNLKSTKGRMVFNEAYDQIWCDLYWCLIKFAKKLIILESQMGIYPSCKDSFSAMESVSHYYDLDHKFNEDKCDNVVTYSADWGLENHKKYGAILRACSGAFVAVDSKSISEKFENWFQFNVKDRLEKNIYPVPIGCPWENNDLPIISELRNTPKENLCYANFSMTSHYRLRVAEWAHQQSYIDCLFPKRFELYDRLLNMDILSDSVMPREQFLKTLSSYKFAICPEGNGVDTHRIWECILTNTVPIAQNNYGNRIFSKIWPMILVPRYEISDIPQLMEDFSQKYKNIDYDYSLLLKDNFPNLLERIKYECERS